MNNHTMFWWIFPRRDGDYQWWWGYRKVTMISLPESEKQRYLEKMRGLKCHTEFTTTTPEHIRT